MPTSLQSKLASLADSFASAVLDTIRSTSLSELISDSGRPASAGQASRPTPKAERASSRGRLKRRSAEDIAEALNQVAALVKGHKNGLRAEQIRAQLGMQSKEMPRVLAEGLAKKKLKKRGQKRATTYFAP
jgi:Fic family protein